MLTIKNLNKIIGFSSNGQPLKRVSETQNVKGEFKKYVFHFDNYDNIQLSMSNDIEIHLNRDCERNGNYELFCMGLQMATSVMVTIQEIKDPAILSTKIKHVLLKTEHWFDNK